MKERFAQFRQSGTLRTYGGTLIALVALVVLFAATTEYFMTVRNFGNILLQMAIIAILAFGMTYVLMLGQIDLSVGSSVAFVGVVLGLMLKDDGNPLLALLAALGLGLVLGLCNGWASAYLGIPTFIVTVATMGIYRGVAYAITDAQPVPIENPLVEWLGNGRVIGIPVPIIIMVVVLIVMHVVLTRTKFGRQIVLAGGNAEAARFAGIKVKRLQVYVFMIMGAAAALSGILMTSRLYSAQPNAATSYELDAIAAAVLGGTSLTGGSGTVFGTFIGALIIAVVNNGMNLLGLDYYFQSIVKGLIIIVAVFIDVRSKKQGTKK